MIQVWKRQDNSFLLVDTDGGAPEWAALHLQDGHTVENAVSAFRDFADRLEELAKDMGETRALRVR